MDAPVIIGAIMEGYMDTDEMFERGVADAYMGDPHPFYYRHYEPYRQGYDQTRRRMRKTGAIPVIDVR